MELHEFIGWLQEKGWLDPRLGDTEAIVAAFEQYLEAEAQAWLNALVYTEGDDEGVA